MTTAGPAPRLNRLFTVSGISTETVRGPIRWGFNTRQEDSTFSVSVLPGAYYVRTPGGFFGEPVTAAQTSAMAIAALQPNVVGFLVETVNADGSLQTDVPSIAGVTPDDENHWVRISTPDAYALGIYVEANVSFVTVRATDVTLRLTDVQYVGSADFVWGADTFVIVLLERHEADQSITEVSNRPTWGRITERGSGLAIVETAVEGTLTSESQETATVLVRYDPGRAIGTSVVDDLGRVWAVSSTRTLIDRRYLEYSLSRTVSS